MKFTIQSQQFTPAEAADITGVSASLQRDWRRRGILPGSDGGKWARFAESDIVRLCVMKIFSDAGVSVSQIGEFASIAVLPTLSHLSKIPGAITFEGREISPEMRERALGSFVRGSSGQYLVMTKGANGASQISRVADLALCESVMSDFGSEFCFVIDCHRLAKKIFQRVGGPLSTIRVEQSDVCGGGAEGEAA